MRWLRTILVMAALAPASPGAIAVLPFGNASATPNSGMDWIGAALSETIREALAKHGVEILERDEVSTGYSLLRLRPLAELTHASVLKLGSTVRAERVIYGTFSHTPGPAGAPGALAIQARILDLRTYQQSSVIEERGLLEDLPSLESHLSWRALLEISPGAAPPEEQHPSMRDAVRLDAEENYIRGLLAATTEQKEKYFLQAARLEPEYWRPALELGRILMARKAYREAAPWLEKVQPGDPGYAEGGFLLGVSKFHSGDMAAAQEIFGRLAEVTPLGGVFNNLGAAQNRLGLAAAAVENFRKALATDPQDPAYHFNLGYALWKSGDFAGAVDSFRATQARDPEDTMATLLLGRSLTKSGPRQNAAADARLLTLERIKESFKDLGYKRLPSR